MVKLNIRSILAVRTMIYETMKEVEIKLTDNQLHMWTSHATDSVTAMMDPVKISEELFTVVSLLYIIYTTSSFQNYNIYEKEIKMCVLVFALIFLRNVDNAI